MPRNRFGSMPVLYYSNLSNREATYTMNITFSAEHRLTGKTEKMHPLPIEGTFRCVGVKIIEGRELFLHRGGKNKGRINPQYGLNSLRYLLWSEHDQCVLNFRTANQKFKRINEENLGNTPLAGQIAYQREKWAIFGSGFEEMSREIKTYHPRVWYQLEQSTPLPTFIDPVFGPISVPESVVCAYTEEELSDVTEEPIKKEPPSPSDDTIDLSEASFPSLSR